MNTESKQKELAFFRKLCRDNNLKVTPKRVLIYEELLLSEDHPCSERLYRRVKNKFPDISLDTVYRTLATFHEIGLVELVEGFSLTKRYDPKLVDHHHIICKKCRSIVDIQCQQFDQSFIPESVRNDFKVQRVHVTIEGLCKKCQSEQPIER